MGGFWEFNHHVHGSFVPNTIKFVGVSSVPLLFWSTSQEWPMTARKSATFLYISLCSPYNVVEHWMNMILPLNCSGLHCCSFMNCWICLRRPNVVNPGNFPLELNRFCINTIQIFQMIILKIPHNFSFQTSFVFFFTSQTEHWVCEDVGLGIRDLTNLVT